MEPRRLRFALAAFAAAFLLWGVAEIRYEMSLLTILGALVGAAGYAAAAVRLQGVRYAHVVGLVGIAPFVFEAFNPLAFNVFLFAMTCFLVGLILLAATNAEGVPGWAGIGVGIVAPLLWIPLDATAPWWEPGNVASLVAFAMLAWARWPGAASKP